MLVIARVDDEWPFNGDLANHVEEILVVAPVVGL